MRALLERTNQELLREIEVLLKLINGANTVVELQDYVQRILHVCEVQRAIIQNNLLYLELDEPGILSDVLSNTRNVTRVVRLLGTRLTGPVIRGLPSDRLCLAIIAWLHTAHPQTARYPAVFSEGSPAIWPFLSIAPIYFFPCAEQQHLLYLALLFHEFGHLLYACHKAEMDDLVAELQREIANLLTPTSSRNDRFASEQAHRRQLIVHTWYSWTQEIFCDAVGFIIGGPAFLHAFSSYLSSMSPTDFFHDPIASPISTHPVTWLRVQLLAKRAAAAGFADYAREIQAEWRIVAKVLGVKEDYHGYYHTSLERALTRTVEDMLTETGPRHYTDSEASGAAWQPGVDSPVRLLNCAWQLYRSDPVMYRTWEVQQIEALVNTCSSV